MPDLPQKRIEHDIFGDDDDDDDDDSFSDGNSVSTFGLGSYRPFGFRSLPVLCNRSFFFMPLEPSTIDRAGGIDQDQEYTGADGDKETAAEQVEEGVPLPSFKKRNTDGQAGEPKKRK